MSPHLSIAQYLRSKTWTRKPAVVLICVSAAPCAGSFQEWRVALCLGLYVFIHCDATIL